MSGFVYIECQDQFDLAIRQLAKASYIAVDTESSGYYTYFSELCLIQISAQGKHYVIDPMADLKLQSLGELCTNAQITKIFHAAASDIAELKRAYNWKFCNIFDTFLACRLLGHASCSLSSLVTEYEGVHLEKKEQKSNWKKRPLSHSQLEYAHLDTVYLESLMSKLKGELETYGMYVELSEEFERVCQIEVETNKEVPLDGWKRLPGIKQLSLEQQAMLRELYLLRDQRARQENIASFRLLSATALIQLVKKRPGTREELGLMQSFHPTFLKKDAAHVLKILKEPNVWSVPLKEHTEKVEKFAPEKKLVLKKLKKWRKRIAEYRGIDLSMVVNSRELDLIAKERPRDIKALEKMGLLTPWKRKTYGPQILDIIAGNYDGSLPEGLTRLSQTQGTGVQA